METARFFRNDFEESGCLREPGSCLATQIPRNGSMENVVLFMNLANAGPSVNTIPSRLIHAAGVLGLRTRPSSVS